MREGKVRIAISAFAAGNSFLASAYAAALCLPGGLKKPPGATSRRGDVCGSLASPPYFTMPRFEPRTKSTTSRTMSLCAISASMASRAWVVFFLLRYMWR